MPQIVDSITSLIKNFDSYEVSLNNMLTNWDLTKNRFDLTSIVQSSEDLLKSLSDYVQENSSKILALTTNIGKGILQWLIAIIVAVIAILICGASAISTISNMMN